MRALFQIIMFSFVMITLLSSCAKKVNTSSINIDEIDEPLPQDDTPDVPPVPDVPVISKEPLSWEKNNPSRKAWSDYLFSVIDKEAFATLDKALDARMFCEQYDHLSREQRINFWGGLIAAVAKFESSWNPLTRYHESTMGTDPVTGGPVYSEGLLQLSYQDVQWAPYCEFNWSVDRNYAATDPRKSILDPYKNLRCGTLILAGQIKRAKNIVLNSGVYWAVLKGNGKYQKIKEIAAITQAMSFCQ